MEKGAQFLRVFDLKGFLEKERAAFCPGSNLSNTPGSC